MALADVGAKGEWEVESFSVGSFGAAGRDFRLSNETSLRYSVIDGLRFSVAALTDDLNVHEVPGLNARNGLNVSGLTEVGTIFSTG